MPLGAQLTANTPLQERGWCREIARTNAGGHAVMTNGTCFSCAGQLLLAAVDGVHTVHSDGLVLELPEAMRRELGSLGAKNDGNALCEER